ncbi:MAG: hypothetical protein SXV54_14940 [Chloroflexota bacterium]|nr:hypothetical protein [Chloroflexota bacterium]
MTWQPALNALYGWQVVIREIYGATEGMFGQQRDEKRVCRQPVVSTPILPRYKIGDLILSFRSLYFRCIGRDRCTLLYATPGTCL